MSENTIQVFCCGFQAYRNTILFKVYSLFLKCLSNLKLTAMGMQKYKNDMEICVIAHNRKLCSLFSSPLF